MKTSSYHEDARTAVLAIGILAALLTTVVALTALATLA